MRVVILLFGLLVLGLAGLGLGQPARLSRLVRDFWTSSAALYLAIALRVVLGVALIVVAPASRFPNAFYVLGLITLAAAVVALVLGTARLRRFVDWWLARPEPFIRIWALVAAGFGVFLISGVVV